MNRISKTFPIQQVNDSDHETRLDMKNIRDFKVTQTRLYKADEIPFRTLFGTSAENRLRSEFRLSRLPVPPNLSPLGQVSLFFINGEFAVGSRVVFIDQLAIEKRRIILTVTGSSHDCDSVYARLKDVLREVETRIPPFDYEPLVVAQESACVVELDAPISGLFSESRVEKLVHVASSITDSHGCQLRLFPSSVRIRVKYEVLPAKLGNGHINLVEKDIIIELREGTSLEENTYFIASPNSSESHLKLIEAIENAFS